jgi:hypothetical protein
VEIGISECSGRLGAGLVLQPERADFLPATGGGWSIREGQATIPASGTKGALPEMLQVCDRKPRWHRHIAADPANRGASGELKDRIGIDRHQVRVELATAHRLGHYVDRLVPVWRDNIDDFHSYAWHSVGAWSRRLVVGDLFERSRSRDRSGFVVVLIAQADQSMKRL